MSTRKKKKTFGQTTIGKILGGAVSLINPTLGSIVTGGGNVEDVLKSITESGESEEHKLAAKRMVLEAYEAEVSDRIAARNREAMVAASGGSDLLFKTIGWTIAASFFAVVVGALGLWEVPEGSQRLFDMAFGAVVAQMTAVVSYYFGSSFGSKQKTDIMNKLNE